MVEQGGDVAYFYIFHIRRGEDRFAFCSVVQLSEPVLRPIQDHDPRFIASLFLKGFRCFSEDERIKSFEFVLVRGDEKRKICQLHSGNNAGIVARPRKGEIDGSVADEHGFAGLFARNQLGGPVDFNIHFSAAEFLDSICKHQSRLSPSGVFTDIHVHLILRLKLFRIAWLHR